MSVSQLSRTNPPPGGKWPNYRFVPAPDSYRPLGGVPGDAHAKAFASAVQQKIDELEEAGCGFSSLIVCPYFANEGFPDLPKGWLDPTVKVVRRAGGIIIADEVQPGFGRVGVSMWGHQKLGFVPDVVTLGKPMANGHPVGGVVTTPENMKAFRSGFRYFNTFGGNPVSAAAAMATLQVIQEEGLLAHARDVGQYALDGLRRLSNKHVVIGDVRGSGLFFGAELVLDREKKTPATAYTKKLVNAMRERGILLNLLGINYNTLKIRPPMPFSRENVDHLLETLDDVLQKTPWAA